jgi:hypothetical protein
MARTRPIGAFLSYTGDSRFFVKSFADIFLSSYGERFDSKNWKERNVAAGENLDDRLKKEIEDSEIFIAFICSDYRNRIAAKELQWAIDLRERRAGLLRIIPLLLTQDGLRYWTEITSSVNGLKEITYKAFYRDAEPNRWIFPEQDAGFVQNIQALRNEIIDYFFKNESSTGDPVPRLGSEPAELCGMPQAVVMLGRPTDAKLDPELDAPIYQASTDTRNALQQAGVAVETWPDNWAELDVEQPLPMNDSGTPADTALFVQPLSPQLAGKYLKQPKRLEIDITGALPEEAATVIAASRMVYWMPEGRTHDGFTQKAITDGDANPAFRIDDPAALAVWIERMLGHEGPHPVVAYQDIETPQDSDGTYLRQRSELQDCLRKEVKSLVGPVLPKNDNDKEIHPFFFGKSDKARPDNDLEATLQMLARRHPILIAHDLNNSGNGILNKIRPRREVVETFRNVQEKADRVLAARGVKSEMVFWLGFLSKGHGLVPKTAKKMPVWGIERWRILELTQTTQGLEIEHGDRRTAILAEMADWARDMDGR